VQPSRPAQRASRHGALKARPGRVGGCSQETYWRRESARHRQKIARLQKTATTLRRQLEERQREREREFAAASARAACHWIAARSAGRCRGRNPGGRGRIRGTQPTRRCPAGLAALILRHAQAWRLTVRYITRAGEGSWYARARYDRDPGRAGRTTLLGQHRHGSIELVPELLGPFTGRRIVVVAGQRVWKLHGRRVGRVLRKVAGSRRSPCLTVSATSRARR